MHRTGPLSGEVAVSGAKNSALKLMAACILTEGTSELTNVPGIVDVSIMAELLEGIGLTVAVDPADRTRLSITTPAELCPTAPFDLVEKMRASIVVLGPLLARCGRAEVALPGGDDFGSRPIDMHLRGLEAMGATFELRHGAVHGHVDGGLRGAEITLEFPSVGATENIVLAAVGAKGTTVLDNAAREPEVVDLLQFLQAMGAEIEGVGTSTVVVHGTPASDRRPVRYQVVPDRVEAATYLACVGVAGGEVHVRHARASHMETLLYKLGEMGLQLTDTGTGVLVRSSGERLRAVDVQTLPFPGVATDYKPMLTAMLSVADGVSIVTENLFAGRFRYVAELLRLGANIRTDAHHAVVRGVERLSGAPVQAHDIRAGAAMVVAALAADGVTEISGINHLDRGYTDLVPKLAGIGVDIQRQ